MDVLLNNIFLLLLINCVNCANILGLFTAPGRSHYNLGSTLMIALAEKGHNVTTISCFGEKVPPPNYKDIVIKEILHTLNREFGKTGRTFYDSEDMNVPLQHIFLGTALPPLMELALKNEEVQSLIHSNATFDVIITEQFLNDAQKAFAAHFGAPLIVLSTIGGNFWINPLIGNPSPLSYFPDIFSDVNVPMTFLERVSNTLIYLSNSLFYNLYVYPKEYDKVKKYFPGDLDLYNIMYNISLVLMNSHPSVNQPVPLVPNVIEIAGYHVKPPKKLRPEFEEYLTKSEHGVIVFSMGSNLRTVDLPADKRSAILRVFSKLKQNVLWKWENETLVGQPPNLKLSKWLPQGDILAHPNCKLFITHGGFLSVTESVLRGVPMLAIPILGDQKINAKIAAKDGYGLVLPYKELTEEKFAKYIKEILESPKFLKNVQQKSKLFRDRIKNPLETAIYWVEYVIRHKGASHLRNAGLDLPWYKYLLLDVAAFILSLLLVVCYLLKFTFKILSQRKKIKHKRS